MPPIESDKKFEVANESFAGSIQKKHRPLPPLPGLKKELKPEQIVQEQKFEKYKQAIVESSKSEKKKPDIGIGSHRDPKAVKETLGKQMQAQIDQLLKSFVPEMQHAPSSTPLQKAEIEARHAMQSSPPAKPTRAEKFLMDKYLEAAAKKPKGE